MNLTEKLLAAHCGKKEVAPGDFVNVRVDVVLANDITAPLAIKEFNRLGVNKVFDPRRVVMVADHFAPNKDIPSAEQCKQMREFAREYGLTHFEVGRGGIEHALLPEQGLVVPGDVVVGADSHTCTYGALSAFATGMGSTDIAVAMATGEIWMKVPSAIKLVYSGKPRQWVSGKDLILHTIGKLGVDGALYCSMEFTGEAIAALSMDGRFTMANMAIEAGGKAGLMRADAKTIQYAEEHSKRAFKIYEADADAQYERTVEFDVSGLEPQVALPSLPSNVKPVSQVGVVDLDQVVIGSCTNGRMDDLRVAAQIMRGKKVHQRMRCIILPGTQQIYLQALREGIIEQLLETGAVVSTPTCGPCLGGYMGVLAAGEKCLSTTNRNFVGRMGSTRSELYLASPAVAAASAIAGRITSPEEIRS